MGAEMTTAEVEAPVHPHPHAHTGRETWTGAALVLVSGIGFGAVTVLARMAFEAGSNATTSLSIRFLLGGLLFWLLLAARRKIVRLPLRRVLAFALMGVFFAAGSTFSFLSVERIPASLSALMFYIYPALVTVGAAVLFGTRFSRTRLAILASVLIGCALTANVQGGSVDTIGIALALISPCFYAGYILVGSRALPGIPPLNASAWIITVASVILLGVGWSGLLGGGFTTDIEPKGWLAILGLAIFSTVISISTFLAGMARLDAFRASILSTFEPVMTVILAALLLGERLAPIQAAGGAIIVVSAIALQVMSLRERQTPVGDGL
jgi:drug/metabolite transporter (DMT)-like permease